MFNKDTIYALATPSGKSALAVIRISGNNCKKILSEVSYIKKHTPNKKIISKIYSDKKSNKILDTAMVTYFKKPKSYTGEDSVEISIHGGAYIIAETLRVLGSTGLCRIAEQGEFTRRALENNKLNLTQAEAVIDLINAETETQKQQAYEQLEGRLGNIIIKWTKEIKKILANVEASIDFSEEDLPTNLENRIKEQTKNIIKEIGDFINDDNYGERIRSGFDISIVGKTNVGKSSLINYLGKREVAIVSSIHGTTRDIIELKYDINGLPVTFYDTAGIRKIKSKIEKIGVKKSLNKAKKSAINLVLLKNENDIKFFEKKIKNTIFVQSKSDILKKKIKSKNVLIISSKTGRGIKNLINEIYRRIKALNISRSAHVSRERHRQLLKKSMKYLIKSTKQTQIDLRAEEIRLALNNISKITGKTDVEDILDIIFNDFCIGK